jgi:aminopeptidase 2
LVDQYDWDFKEKESDKTAHLRTLAISMAGHHGDQAVIEEAQTQFKKYTTPGKGHGEDAIHANLKGTVFALVVRYGGKKEYEDVLDIYQKHTVADVKVAALTALTASRDMTLIERTLNLSLNDDIVRDQDVIYIFRSISLNEKARRPTWAFLQNKWDELYKRFHGGSISTLSSIVSASTSELTTLQDEKDMETFFDGKDISDITRAVKQSKEKIHNFANWLTHDREPVAQWLAENVPLMQTFRVASGTRLQKKM